MPIVSTDIHYRLSGGAANTVHDASLGGAKSSTQVGANIFDTVTGDEAAAGDVEYRCIYIHNNHGSLTLENAVVWIDANTPSPDTVVAIGLGTAAINGTEQTVANESTAPTSVTFSTPANKAGGLAIGNLPAGQHKSLWIRRTVSAAAAAVNSDTFSIRTAGDTAA
jgi:hypothetical protein